MVDDILETKNFTSALLRPLQSYPSETKLRTRFLTGGVPMKPEIHPHYDVVDIHCACGSTFQTRSTKKEALHVDICSACHPFYTGKQRLVDTAGRIDRFRKKFNLPK